jgi:acetyl esterase/lipase
MRKYFLAYFLVLVLGLVSVKGKAETIATGDTITLRTLMQDPNPMQEMVYKRTKDTTLKIYFTKPADAKPGKKYPAVIWIHGGGWTAGDAKGFFPHARYYALRGAVGFSIEYRLIKFGGSGMAECLEDCKSAIRFIRAHAKELNIDPDQIIVLGDSAGGHLAGALGTIDGFDDPADNLGISAKVSAMVLYNPCVDMTVYPLMKNAIANQVPNIKTLDSASITSEQWELARTFSPINHIKAGQPHCLIMHGLNDKVIPYEQSVRFKDAMKKAGNDCQVILLPNTRHAFVVPNYSATEEQVVNAITEGDKYLTNLGYLKGKPTLRVSDIPSWPPKKK